MNSKKLALAFIKYSGGIKVTPYNLNRFIADHSDLFAGINKSTIEKSINKGIDDLLLSIKFKTASIKDIFPSNFYNEEIKNFLKIMDEKPLVNVLASLEEFPFKRESSKRHLRAAIKSVYAEELEELGAEPKEQEESVENKEKEFSKKLDENPEGSKENITEEPSEETETAEKYLPQDIEQDAILSLEKYLQKHIFNSKLIPKINIIEASEIKNGYIIKIEFSADDKTKAYAQAVIYNHKLILPAELESENGEKLGDFNQETFSKVFSIGEAKSEKEEDYNDLSKKTMESPPETAFAYIEKIKKKYGEYAANDVLTRYIEQMNRKKTSSIDVEKLRNIKKEG